MMYLARSFICKINDSGLLSRVQRYVKLTSAYDKLDQTKKENDLQQALPTENIPGPRAMFLLGNWFRFIPYIGQYSASDMVKQLRKLRECYGDIVKLDGLMHGRAYILLFSSELCEKMYQKESNWPTRISIENLRYCKQNDLAASQGKTWHDFRSKVESYIMEPQTIKAHIMEINDITDEFIRKMYELRLMTWELPANFRNELYKWSLESRCSIALDCRLGCLNPNLAANSEPQIMINCMHDLFDLTYRMDSLPPLWKIYNRRNNHKKLLRVLDTLDRIASKHIEQAEAELCETTNDDTNLHDHSILKKLLRLDKQTAHVMALEMLLSGIDTEREQARL